MRASECECLLCAYVCSCSHCEGDGALVMHVHGSVHANFRARTANAAPRYIDTVGGEG